MSFGPGKKRRLEKTESKASKLVKRGAMNWNPPIRSGEDRETCQVHEAWLKSEFKKKGKKNLKAVEKRMDATYALRREFLLSTPRKLSDIKEQ